MLTDIELKNFLDLKYDQYNQSSFIETDPIQIPHKFSKKEDIEIAAFLISVIAWGKREQIIKSGERIINILNNDPLNFIINSSEAKIENAINQFAHRTFNNIDLFYFILSLKNIYLNHGGLESVFTKGYEQEKSIFSALNCFRTIFFELNHQERTEKHIADVLKRSAAKRLNLFLMWMIRNDNRPVHFGIWKGIPISNLMIPLDIHSGNTSRALGLLKRKQNDWKAVEELTNNLKAFDPKDPVKYDFSLFGLGVFEGFKEFNNDL